MDHELRAGDYNFCHYCGQISGRDFYCDEVCESKYRAEQERKFQKTENRQKWLESLNARLLCFSNRLGKDKLARVRKKQVKELMQRIEDQYTTITWEIHEKRKKRSYKGKGKLL